MIKIDFYAIAIAVVVIFLSGIFGGTMANVIHSIMFDNESATQQPAPEAIASVPSLPDEPAPSLVDFEDMAGLDVATQELLNERYRDIGPADFEKRLRRLEWAVSALSDRVFGKSLLPGEGQIGELGSEAAND